MSNPKTVKSLYVVKWESLINLTDKCQGQDWQDEQWLQGGPTWGSKVIYKINHKKKVSLKALKPSLMNQQK